MEKLVALPGTPQSGGVVSEKFFIDCPVLGYEDTNPASRAKTHLLEFKDV